MRTKKAEKKKSGIRCPACGDEIYSMYRHDFVRCRCGKTFIDGGDEYMRAGVEDPFSPNDIKLVETTMSDADRKMSERLRDPQSTPRIKPVKAKRPKGIQFCFVARDWWKVLPRVGKYPKSGPYAGCIYKWWASFGPIQIRRWA